MEQLSEFIKDNKLYIVAGSAVVVSSLLIYRRFKPKRARVCGVDYPKDTVILHAFTKSRCIPNLGHFVMKLETYLRINKIPFQVVYDFNFKGGPKNKTPWIEYNGVTMGDSQLIMEFLNKKFNIELNSHLSKQERATAWAIQKWIEECTYWLNVYSRWIIYWDDMIPQFLNAHGLQAAFMKLALKPRLVKILYTQGVGRHSNEEIHQMMVKDLRIFSDILGDKRYIMGDRITETDCAAFGVLSQVRWSTPESCPGHQLLTSGALQNVIDYLDRIKNTYWKDWEEIIADRNK